MAVSEKLITVAAFEAFLERPENRDRLFELIDGEIVEKLPTEKHQIIVANLYDPLKAFVKAKGLGRVLFEVRRRIPEDHHNARLPDLEFTSAERLLPVVEKSAVPQMPNLCIEVKSPNDTYLGLREKAIYYLKNGAKLVWLVFPERQQIEIHTYDAPIITLSIGDTLDGGTVLPGFSMSVVDVFAEL